MDALLNLAGAILAAAFFWLWRREARRARWYECTLRNEKAQALSLLETELREQKRERRELEEVLAALQDAVVMVDVQMRVRYLNSAALALFGVRIENVLGAQLIEVLPSFGLERSVQTALREAQSSTREITLHTPHPREVLLRISPARRGGQIIGAAVILQDLTELRRLETSAPRLCR